MPPPQSSRETMSTVLAYITINVNPVLLHVGPFTVRWYGLMYAVGLGLALWVTLPLAEGHGAPRDALYAIFWGVTIAGLIGGRLYFVVQNRPARRPTPIVWPSSRPPPTSCSLAWPCLGYCGRCANAPGLRACTSCSTSRSTRWGKSYCSSGGITPSCSALSSRRRSRRSWCW